MDISEINKHHERKIVHVKDIFPGPHNEATSPGLGWSASNANRDSDSDDNDDDEVDNEEPAIIQASNSEVFFGRQANEISGQNNKLPSRTKHQAPRAPVLVDVDVGFSEQDLFGSSLALATGYNDPTHVDKSQHQLTSPTVTNGKSPRRRTPSNALPDDLESGCLGESSRYGDNEVDSLDVTGFMTSFGLGLTASNAKHVQSTGNLDNSSSDIETDDSVTRQVPAGGENQFSFVTKENKKQSTLETFNGYHGYHSKEAEYDSLEEGGSFEEEEATLDFGVEDGVENNEGPVEGRHRHIYQEYHGEDYSHYLREEPPEDARKGKRRLKKHRDKLPSVSPTSSTSMSSGEHSIKRSLKLKLGQVFSIHGTNESARRKSGPDFVSNIQNFSYADSKIGHDGINESLGNVAELSEGHKQQWWNKGTLSAQVLPSHKDIMLKPRHVHLPSDFDLSSNWSDPLTSAQENNFSDIANEVHSADEFMNADFSDFESYRKNLMYNTKVKKVRKPNIWNRLTLSSKSKRDKHYSEAPFGENEAVNPLTSMDDVGNF